MRHDLAIEIAHARDLSEIIALENTAWPDGMRASDRNLACRVERGLMVVARDCQSGAITGLLTTFRPRWLRAEVLSALVSDVPAELLAQESNQRWRRLADEYHLARDWHEATGDGAIGDMHDPLGEVVFGVGISTDPRVRGRGIAKAMLHGALAEAGRTGASFFAAYGRLPQFHRSELSLDDYLSFGERAPEDIGLRLHWSVGAKPVRTGCGQARYVGIPSSMHHDPESRGCGFLVITPVDRRP